MLKFLQKWRWWIFIAFIAFLFVGLWKECLSTFLNVNSPAITALATFIIALFTATLWRTTNQTLEHNRTVERAYVKMSSLPPGLEIETQTGFAWVSLEIQNFGETPATITDIFLNHEIVSCLDSALVGIEFKDTLVVNPMPDVNGIFLVKNDRFNFTREIPLSSDAFEINAQASILFLYGHIDYIDIFGKRHRAGYGRKYAPGYNDRNSYRTDDDFFKRSNLIFAFEKRFNYDRERKRGEGKDWNEKI